MKPALALLAAVALVVLPACSDDDGDLEAFCGRYQAVLESEFLDPSETLGAEPQEVERSIENNLSAARRAREVAPEEIRDDVDTIIGAAETFDETLREFDYNLVRFVDEAGTERIQELQDEVGGREVQAASRRVNRFLEEECDVAPTTTIEGEGGATSSTTPADLDPQELADLIRATIPEDDLETIFAYLEVESVDELVEGIVNGTFDLETLEAVAQAPPGTPFRYGDDEELDAGYDACADGDLPACDRLRLDAPAGSEYQQFAAKCGDRLDEPATRACESELDD